MPRKRNPENRGLPARWRRYHGAIYYQVPPGQEKHWDGKKQFKLGDTLPAAHAVFSSRIDPQHRTLRTVGDLIDRYSNEVLPTKSPNTQDVQVYFLRQLKDVFGKTYIGDIEPQDIYRYVDQRSKKKTNEQGETRGGPSVARREVKLFSHVYTKAVEWGCLKRHPFKGEVLLTGEDARDRYVEDAEILACFQLNAKRKGETIPVVQAYIRVKLLIGLRQADMLRLRVSDCKDDGLHAYNSKTRKRTIYEWSSELRAAVDEAMSVRPVDISPWLFCTRRGKCYVSDRDKTRGFRSMWQRFMAKLIENGLITDAFTEHDLRAKCASDAATLEHARALLAHADSRTTKRIYRRKPERVKPAK